MSRQEQNDRHIIWSDISLDLDDWRESLEELYPGYSDDELYDIMVKSNAENLYDERVNLNIQLSQPIIVIGDLGRWNGRVSGYKMIDSGNINSEIFFMLQGIVLITRALFPNCRLKLTLNLETP